MIGGKVVLTYKRKRTLLRSDCCHGNILPDKSEEGTISNTLSASNKHHKSTEDGKSENRKIDSGVCELVAGGTGSNIAQSDRSCDLSSAQSINLTNDVPEGERLCSDCIKEHGMLMPRNAQTFNKINGQQLPEKSDSDELVFRSCCFLERSAGGNGCQDISEGTFTKDSYIDKCLGHDKGDSFSCMNSGKNLQEQKCTKESSLSLSVNSDSGICPDLDDSMSSVDKEHRIRLVAASAPKTESSEATSSELKDKYCSSCVNAIAENKSATPLITFCRRSKRVKDVKGPAIRSNLQGGDYFVSTFEGSELACIGSASTLEASSACAVKNPVHDMHSVDYPNKNHLLGEAQRTNFIPSPDSMHAPASSAPDRPIHEKEPTLSPICSAKDSPSIAQGEVSDRLANEGLKATHLPDEFGSYEGSLAAGSLSIPPPGVDSLPDGTTSRKNMDSHFVVDCNIALESDSDEQVNHTAPQVLGDSVESESQTTLLGVSPGERGLDFSGEGIAENLSSDKERPLEHECGYVKPIGNGCGHVNSTLLAERMSKNIFLQLFPEDRSNAMLPLGNSQQHMVDCLVSAERNGSLTESWNGLKRPSARHQPLVGHSLAMGPTIEVHAQNSTMFRCPNVGLQSKEFLHDSVSRLFLDPASSLLRYKMTLDCNIDTKGYYRNRFLGQFENPSLWLEEELDCLWVGVRRHGRGNWEHILKDSRLQFLSWRTPQDLAERWQEEMHKLFSNMPVSHMTSLRTTDHILLDRLNCLFFDKTREENLVGDDDDMKLSLGVGEVYSQSMDMDGLQERPKFTFVNVHDAAHNQLQKTCPSSHARKCTRLSSDCWEGKVLINNSSSNADEPKTRMTSNGSLPHWLKEVVAIPPPMHQDPSLLSLASSLSCCPMQTLDQPHLESIGIHHETRTRSAVGILATCRTELQTGGIGRANWGNSPEVTRRNAENASSEHHVDAQQNLIIIDSDASSEETISDDQSLRV